MSTFLIILGIIGAVASIVWLIRRRVNRGDGLDTTNDNMAAASEMRRRAAASKTYSEPRPTKQYFEQSVTRDRPRADEPSSFDNSLLMATAFSSGHSSSDVPEEKRYEGGGGTFDGGGSSGNYESSASSSSDTSSSSSSDSSSPSSSD